VEGDDEIDMSAELIDPYFGNLVAQDLRDFLHRNDLTQADAASILGRSRRQIGYYLKKARSTHHALACTGYEALMAVSGERKTAKRAAAPTVKELLRGE